MSEELNLTVCLKWAARQQAAWKPLASVFKGPGRHFCPFVRSQADSPCVFSSALLLEYLLAHVSA